MAMQCFLPRFRNTRDLCFSVSYYWSLTSVMISPFLYGNCIPVFHWLWLNSMCWFYFFSSCLLLCKPIPYMCITLKALGLET